MRSDRLGEPFFKQPNSVKSFQGLCFCRICLLHSRLSLCVGGEKQPVILSLLLLKILPQLIIVLLEESNQFSVRATCLPKSLSLHLCGKLANSVETRKSFFASWCMCRIT
ncbi:hypothetical protein CAL11_18290 [Bordetella genomosp. 6]|nr:hypothetical protein CAL11_18290 [Bordetella genomosp. 6]